MNEIQVVFCLGSKILLNLLFEYGNVIYPKVDEIVFTKTNKRYKVTNVIHCINDNYTIYINLKVHK
jgi:urate oxidase